MGPGEGYVLTLEFTHPKRTPEEVSGQLKLDPDRCWNAGSAMNTRYGEALAGRNAQMSWFKTLLSTLPEELSLARALGRLLDQLEPVRDYLAAFTTSGGSIRIAVWGDCAGGGGAVLTPDLLKRLGESGVLLALR